MRIREMLENVAAGFVRTRKDEGAGGAADAAVAEIALLIAALDGSVLPEEFASYQWIAGRCASLSEAERKQRLDDAVTKAGRLLLMAQVGAYSEADRLDAFGETVRELLPDGLAGRSVADVRRSFVLWISLAMSDGEFSGVERQAIESLHSRLAPSGSLECGFFETAERLLRNLADASRRSDAERELDQFVVFASADR